MENNNVVLLVGKYSSGKTSSLRNVNLETTAYINTDAKPLSFTGKPKIMVKLPSVDVLIPGLKKIEEDPTIDHVVIDTLSFLMEMYETEKIYTLPKSQQQSAWTPYAQFYRTLVHFMKHSKKKYTVICHTHDIYNEAELVTETKALVKGGVGKRGVEADFTTIVSAKRIVDENSPLGFRYVFQTQLTKETLGEGIRSPIGMWSQDEVYIDNDIMLVHDRITNHYKKGE